MIFFKHKYFTNPAITPADAIDAAATDLASQLRGHHTRHLGREQLHDLTNLEAIFSDAAATNAADPNPNPNPNPNPESAPADCRVVAPRAEVAAGPKKKAVVASSFERRPALTTASPTSVIHLPRAAPHLPPEVPPRPRVERGHLPAQALESAPLHRVPPAPAALR